MTSDFSVAVHALVFLNHKGDTQSSEALAENICTNPARVRKVMARLKKAGLVDTKEGAVGGGYRFAGDASAIDLAAVARAVDARFVEALWRSGRECDCLISSGMGGLMDGIFADLNDRCMTRLGELTIQDLDRRIFQTART